LRGLPQFRPLPTGRGAAAPLAVSQAVDGPQDIEKLPKSNVSVQEFASNTASRTRMQVDKNRRKANAVLFLDLLKITSV